MGESNYREVEKNGGIEFLTLKVKWNEKKDEFLKPSS